VAAEDPGARVRSERPGPRVRAGRAAAATNLPSIPTSVTRRHPRPRHSPNSPSGLYFRRAIRGRTDHPAIVPLAGGRRVSEVPYRVDKPWGYELIWARTDRYVGKVLHVKAGHVLSLQYHNRKDETMHVLRGELILRTRPGEMLEARAFKAGDSVHIPARLVHQIEAVVDSDVLEASTPELDDLVRLSDRYGRG
jgi:mannose-6-phosphate isomerase